VSSPYGDLDRPPLSEQALAGALVRPGELWQEVRVVAETGSTNADLAAAAERGAGEGLVLVAESQTAGRGRLHRDWTSPPRAGLTFSVLLRPDDVPATRWGWLPLLAGLSVARAVARLGELEARLKWPNDVLVGPDRRKAAGLLAQVAGDAVVVGIGLNVTTRADELPDGATSLAASGSSCSDRDPLLRALLRALAQDYRGWRAAGGDAEASGLAAAYAGLSDTLGREVVVTLPAGDPVRGVASAIGGDGRLVVTGGTGTRTVAAGDVTHVRPA
jgi:BirA family transcriptional regulator, biotin operon repressor / biotin---[acetyl-CoA-carboxylase] ligase